MNINSREEYNKNKVYLDKDNCPFCSSEVCESSEILHVTDYWIIRYNKFPYFGKKKTLLAFPKVHKEFTRELTPEEYKDLHAVDEFMKDFFVGEEYFSFIRQTRSNKSVEHLHYHYLTGIPAERTIDGENYFKIKD